MTGVSPPSARAFAVVCPSSAVTIVTRRPHYAPRLAPRPDGRGVLGCPGSSRVTVTRRSSQGFRRRRSPAGPSPTSATAGGYLFRGGGHMALPWDHDHRVGVAPVVIAEPAPPLGQGEGFPLIVAFVTPLDPAIRATLARFHQCFTSRSIRLTLSHTRSIRIA